MFQELSLSEAEMPTGPSLARTAAKTSSGRMQRTHKSDVWKKVPLEEIKSTPKPDHDGARGKTQSKSTSADSTYSIVGPFVLEKAKIQFLM